MVVNVVVESSSVVVVGTNVELVVDEVGWLETDVSTVVVEGSGLVCDSVVDSSSVEAVVSLICIVVSFSSVVTLSSHPGGV